jgi:hypothetical protein
MCPVCFASAGVIAASLAGAGGLAVLMASTLVKNKPVALNPKKEDSHDDKH